MKRNWIVISLMFLLTAALWAQVATPPAQTTPDTNACACCNHQAKADGAATPSCCSGKDAKACSRKGGKGCCDGMKGMKMDASASDKTMSCGKDCCKDGKCQMAKKGKKCCAHCAEMAEGK